MNTIASAPDGVMHSDRSFLGHPKGLGFLAFTEAWERFSYYGMQALLVLYMKSQLLLPGHIEHVIGFGPFRTVLERINGAGVLSVLELSSVVFGAYTFGVYAMPILGGLLADRFLGLTRTVTLGALLMAAGHFLMAFDATFLIALACLVVGVGCFKGNLAGQVGNLYGPEDLRRADAFQIYYLAINAGVIAAPLIVGTLGEKYAWHYGFEAAGVGMLISLLVYGAGRSSLPPDPRRRRAVRVARPKLTRDERIAVVVLLVLLPVLAVGAVGNQQIFNSYLVWAPDNVDLTFFGRTMPTTWLITVDSIVSVSALAAAMVFWRLWARRFREPSEGAKIALGMFISAIAMLCPAIASHIAAGGHKAQVGWVLAFHTLNSIGFSNVFPVGLALYARAAPKAIVGTIIGFYYLHLATANFLVGKLGTLLDKLPGTQFWLLHAGLVGGAGAIFLVTKFIFARQLAPTAAPDAVAAAAS
ncbi:MAG TPA: peptide MFS transporter [Steroidobacteraceae bacterium]|nr:peptide MFS transporter [Steroidobacteraceae bacterium]